MEDGNSGRDNNLEYNLEVKPWSINLEEKLWGKTL